MTKFLLASLLLLRLTAPLSAAEAGAAKRSAELDAAKRKLSDHAYDLRYRFTAGEAYRTKVVHLVTVDTKIQGVSETAKTRSVSTKVWNVSHVDAQGNITFDYKVESADMWQQVTDRPEIHYDSTSKDDPPPEYKHVAETIGQPMATVKISPAGRIVERKNARPQFNPGIGELTVPLPDQPVKIGVKWHIDGELPVRLQEGTIKAIKTRQEYTLENVQTGVATISVRTQVLTPVNDPAVQAQIVQRVKQGTIRFDVDAGRVLSQQTDIDETVIGFRGADSMMKYLSRLTEEMVKPEGRQE